MAEIAVRRRHWRWKRCERVMDIGRHPVSLDRPVGRKRRQQPLANSLKTMLQRKPDPQRHTMAFCKQTRSKSLLKTLTYREREIIRLRYGLGDGYTYTLEEVGRIFKVTRERVRQIEAKAVRKLQHPVRSQQLEGFLKGVAAG